MITQEKKLATPLQQAVTVLQLRHFKDSFITEDKYFAFVSALKSTANPSVVLDDEDVVCSLGSPVEAEKALRGRIVSRLMNDPERLELFEKLLQSEEMVEYGQFEISKTEAFQERMVLQLLRDPESLQVFANLLNDTEIVEYGQFD